MNRNEFERLAIESIYGEISDQDQKRLDTWLEEKPEARKEYVELKQAHGWLSRLDDLPASTQPINTYHFANASKPRRRRWLVSTAAACLVFLLFASQGFVLQVGKVRFAFGPAADTSAVREEIRAELNHTYQPIMTRLIHLVDDLKSEGHLIAERQEVLERSMQLLAAFRKADREQMKDFSVELIREIDDRLNELYASAVPVIVSDDRKKSPNGE